jgi:SAM-dependent methyltransferase
MKRREFITAAGVLGASGVVHAVEQRFPVLAQAAPQARSPDVIFVPTPNDVVNKMLEMARVTAKDIVYDLGCGDGRIVITAAQKYGARGVGIDIDPQRIREARENASRGKVNDKVRFVQADLFEADISEATVVTLYLLTELNLKLRPKLMADLKPGTRVVSHAFAMGDWKPERSERVDGAAVYLWRIPPR